MPLDSYDYLIERQKIHSTPQSIRALPNYDDLLAAQIKRDTSNIISNEKSNMRLDQNQYELEQNRQNLRAMGKQNNLATAISIGNIGAEGYRAYENRNIEKEKDLQYEELGWKEDAIIDSIIRNASRINNLLSESTDIIGQSNIPQVSVQSSKPAIDLNSIDLSKERGEY